MEAPMLHGAASPDHRVLTSATRWEGGAAVGPGPTPAFRFDAVHLNDRSAVSDDWNRAPSIRCASPSARNLRENHGSHATDTPFDFCLVSDRATMTLAINFHTFLPQSPRCGER
jgi:hypothetical protein